MNSLTFQGHARRKAFNPVKVPDVSQKYLNESQSTIRGMKDVAQALIDNRNATISQVRDNQRKELAQIADNQQLQRGFDQETKASMLQAHQANLLSIKSEGIQDKEMEDLMAMIPKAISNVAKANNQFNEEARKDMIGLAVHFTTDEERRALNFVGKNVEWADTAINKVINRLELAGNQAAADQLRNVSGRKLLALQELTVTDAAKNAFPRIVTNSLNKKSKKYGVTLQSVLDNPTKENRTIADGILRELQNDFYTSLEWDGQSPDPSSIQGGYTTAFLGEHAAPHVDETVKKYLKEYDDALAVETNDQNRETRQNKLKAAMTSSGKTAGNGDPQGVADGFFGWVRSEAGGDKSLIKTIRIEGWGHVEDLVASGEMTGQQWREFKNSTIMIGDKPQRVGDLYKDEIDGIDKAFVKRVNENDRLRTAKEKEHDLQMQDGVFNLSQTEGRYASNKEIENIKASYKANGFPVPRWVTDYETAEQMDVNYQTRWLDDTASSPGGLTMAQLYSRPILSPELLKKYEKQTIDGPESIPTQSRTEFLSGIANKVHSVVSETMLAPDLRSQMVKIKSGRAKTLLTENVRYGLATGAYKNALQAWTSESELLAIEIDKGKGEWAIKKLPNGDNAYAGFLDLQLTRSDEKGQRYGKLSSDNNNFINLSSADGGVDAADVEELKKRLVLREFPSYIDDIMINYPTLDRAEIANKILVANGEKPVESVGAAKTYKFVHPSIKSLVGGNKTSLHRTDMAITGTNKIVDNKETDTTLNLLKDGNVVTADESSEGYEVVSTTQSQNLVTNEMAFGTTIAETSIDQVVNNPSVLEVGPFNIDKPTFKTYIKQGYLTGNEVLTKETQDYIAKLDMYDQSGTFYTNNKEPIWGVGQKNYSEDFSEVPSSEILGDIITKHIIPDVVKGFGMAGDFILDNYNTAGVLTRALGKLSAEAITTLRDNYDPEYWKQFNTRIHPDANIDYSKIPGQVNKTLSGIVETLQSIPLEDFAKAYTSTPEAQLAVQQRDESRKMVIGVIKYYQKRQQLEASGFTGPFTDAMEDNIYNSGFE